MSVWLTPELKPFIGGTYFPPADRARRPGLKTVLNRIIDQVKCFTNCVLCFVQPTYTNIYNLSVSYDPQWQNNRPTLESSGDRILEALKKGTAVSASPGESPPLAPGVANRCFQQLARSYEEEYGGFREAPKFPTPGRLSRYHSGRV